MCLIEQWQMNYIIYSNHVDEVINSGLVRHVGKLNTACIDSTIGLSIMEFKFAGRWQCLLASSRASDVWWYDADGCRRCPMYGCVTDWYVWKPQHTAQHIRTMPGDWQATKLPPFFHTFTLLHRWGARLITFLLTDKRWLHRQRSSLA